MKTKVFIDGSEGTTGLRIFERFQNRDDIEILKIDPELRKDPEERKKMINASDITFLCLPDAASIESVGLVENENVTIIDDPLMEGGFASCPFDAEGVATKTKTVIENGTLNTLLHNRTTAEAMGKETTGNASRLLAVTIGLSTLGGWAVLLIPFFLYRPLKAQAGHIRSVAGGESVQYTGRLTVGRDGFRIPGSIPGILPGVSLCTYGAPWRGSKTAYFSEEKH